MVVESRLYDLSEVSPNASAEEIKKQYKKQALKHHPDRGGSTQKFQELTAAYEVLSDDKKRELYDRYGEEGLRQTQQGGDGSTTERPQDVFGSLFRDLFGEDGIFSGESGSGGMRYQFGRSQNRPRKPEDTVLTFQVTYEDLFKGVTKRFAIERTITCKVCDGRGASCYNAEQTCTDCNGRGMRVITRRRGPMIQQMQTVCPTCNGSGSCIPSELLCKQCRGDQIQRERYAFDVQVPPGCRDGQRFVFTGQGDSAPGAKAGNIVCILQTLEHPRFTRSGNHLVSIISVTLNEALSGCAVNFEHLDHRQLLLRTRLGDVIRPNSLWRVQREGMPIPGQPSARGDLFLRFDVVFPESFDAESARRLAEAFNNVKERAPTSKRREWFVRMLRFLRLNGFANRFEPPADPEVELPLPAPGAVEYFLEEVRGADGNVGDGARNQAHYRSRL
eukprot:TRINITY_DN73645_c0_g1_i1.p1 TRINITY_DN73645_c0_g1~~TRINITY_DN73645_c0_g1_i1.p1  ORF type:complete len:455 (-),score=49.25 TRINITY_DN73645_c0_g1_i1:30-1367(-)